MEHRPRRRWPGGTTAEDRPPAHVRHRHPFRVATDETGRSAGRSLVVTWYGMAIVAQLQRSTHRAAEPVLADLFSDVEPSDDHRSPRTEPRWVHRHAVR